MKSLFPQPAGVAAWHRDFLGASPFSCDAASAAASFFSPARRLCSAPVPAEKALPRSIPAPLRARLGLALRCWQASQRVTLDLVGDGKKLPGMDLGMTMNFAMALGNYSRFLLFRAGGGLPAAAAVRLHAAFAGEMALMPAAMALRGAAGRKAARRNSPGASAARLAAAFAAALEAGK